MIDKALTYLADFLNHELVWNTGSDKDVVVVSSLVNLDGSIADEAKNKMVVSVINLEHETAVKSFQTHVVKDNTVGKRTRPVYLNMYMMVSANYNSEVYAEALKMLSLSVGVFQANPYFSKKEHPDMPEPLEQLNLEIVNLPLNELSHIWSGIGAKYVPSMLYKVRMIGIQEDKIAAEVPGITGMRSDSKLKNN